MKYTPWGKPQFLHEIAEGITAVTTASHGGLKLDRKRNAQMPKPARRKGGWYEEDCEWSLVALRFPEHFTMEQDQAKRTAINWLPEEYEALTGRRPAVEESYELRRRDFNKKNEENFVVISATGVSLMSHDREMVRCLAERRLDGERRAFLVEPSEYSRRREFGFVINMRNHQEIPAPRR